MNRWPIAFLFVIQFSFSANILAQVMPAGPGLPEVIHYTRQEFNAYKQNWCVAQDAQGQIYVANSRGLLRFDGSEWQQLYPLFFHQHKITQPPIWGLRYFMLVATHFWQ